MKTLVVDDRQLQVNKLVRLLGEIYPDGECYGNISSLEALEYAKEHKPDVAFLDVEMPEMNGIELAKKLVVLYPKLNIIFVTGHREYAADAFSVFPSGFLEKPVDKEGLLSCLENLRYPVEEEAAEDGDTTEGAEQVKKRLFARCFGEFEIFCDGVPLKFKRSKSKELFAYLVSCCGASVSPANIVSVLWEDDESTSEKSQSSMCRTLIADILHTLSEKGFDDVLRKSWKNVYLNTEFLDCDYYDFLERNKGKNIYYNGAFMAQYSWAEYILPKY